LSKPGAQMSDPAAPALKPGWSGPMLRYLSAPITDQPPVTEDQLRQLRERYDVLLVPREPQRESVPLIAAVLAGQAADIRPRDADHWLLLREPMPEGALPLTQVLAARPDALLPLTLAALEAMHELHERGVILNEGARAGRQFLAGSPARVVVGWFSEWATVVDPDPGASEARPTAPLVLCSDGDDCAHYPARDLLWFVADLPRSLPLGPVGEMLVALAWPAAQPAAIFALAPLALLRAMDLPEGWEAHATPVGGPRVSVAHVEPPLVRDAWNVQKCGAAAEAVRCNGSDWARGDLREALQALRTQAPLIVVRAVGGQRQAVVVRARQQWQRIAGNAADQLDVLHLDMDLEPAELSGAGEMAGEQAGEAGMAAGEVEGEVAGMAASGAASTAAAEGARQLLSLLLKPSMGRVREDEDDDEGDEQAGPGTHRRLRSVLELFGIEDAPQQEEEGAVAGGEAGEAREAREAEFNRHRELAEGAGLSGPEGERDAELAERAEMRGTEEVRGVSEP
jgi:hypothetical protein